MSVERLQERVTAGGLLSVDAKAGVVRGVRILGPESANGRRYSEAAIRGAARLYEGLHVNLGHHTQGGERPVTTRIGWLEAVRFSDGGLRGDLHLLTSHPHATVVLEAAERRPDLFGLSHDAEGRARRKDGTLLVEEITAVRSVDVVCDPATTRSLFESRFWTQPADSREFVRRLREGDLDAAAATAAEEPRGGNTPSPADKLRGELSRLSKELSLSLGDLIREVEAAISAVRKDGQSVGPPAADGATVESLLGNPPWRRSRRQLTESKRFALQIT